MSAKQLTKFELGRIVTTATALDILTYDEILSGLLRHITGDWGDVSKDDRKENDMSLEKGFRLVSVYHTDLGVKFLVTTEATRSATTVMLPEDY